MNQGNNQTNPHARARTRTQAAATINILIACEESQRECIAFRALGFNAYSCDIQRPMGGHPEWAICSDVTPYLQGQTTFQTCDGITRNMTKWHLIIAHPPCTYLCKVSSVHMVKNGILQQERFALMERAREFFMLCLNAQADYVAVENPLPMARAQLPPPSCFVHPSWYGEKYTKKTLYWLRNLPPLMAKIDYVNPKSFVRASRGKYRSRTFPKLAAAIADQWGNYILDEIAR